MNRAYDARLVGGPYDGDEGAIPEAIPAVLVFPCDPRFGCGPSCPAGGVHWAPPGTRLPPVVRVERYVLDEDSVEEDWLLYVYPEPTEPLDAEREQELAVA